MANKYRDENAGRFAVIALRRSLVPRGRRPLPIPEAGDFRPSKKFAGRLLAAEQGQRRPAGRVLDRPDDPMFAAAALQHPSFRSRLTNTGFVCVYLTG